MTTLHTAPTVLPVTAPPITDGAVAVDGDRIVWVGPATEWTGGGDRVDWPGLLTPGLVNAHAHLQYSAYADMCEPGVDFLAWISRIRPRNATMTEDDWRASTQSGVDAAIRTGTTAVADVTAQAVAVEVVAASRLAGVSYLEAVGADDAVWPERKQVLLDLLDRCGPDNVGVSPHTLYTLSTEVFRDCVALARERGLRLHPHAAESPYEVEFVATGTGPFADANQRWGLAMELLRDGGSKRSPVAELAALGAVGPDVHLAHGVQTDEVDRALLRESGTVVALCPRSNAVLGVGAAPVAAYRAEGVPVAVGTDGLSSVPSMDLLADVAALRELALAQGTGRAGLDRWLVEAATLGGARALGLTGEIGELRPGARADLAVFDVPAATDPYAALVGASGTCIGTVLGGSPTMGG